MCLLSYMKRKIIKEYEKKIRKIKLQKLAVALVIWDEMGESGYGRNPRHHGCQWKQQRKTVNR